MLGTGPPIRRGARDEAEKPFWISYADLMSSLAVLFLVVMLAALIIVTRSNDSLAAQSALARTQLDAAIKAKADLETARQDAERAQAEAERAKAEAEQEKAAAETARAEAEQQRQRADAARAKAEKLASKNQTLAAEAQANRRLVQDFDAAKERVLTTIRNALPAGAHLAGEQIDFGSAAQFAQGRSDLTPAQQSLLRSAVPTLVDAADGVGRGVLRRIVVEGFASREGSYLLNLNLSLARSQRLMCAILDSKPKNGRALSQNVQARARQLFLVGGYSSNSLQATPSASRRIELRIEWWDPRIPEDQRRDPSVPPAVANGQCALGG